MRNHRRPAQRRSRRGAQSHSDHECISVQPPSGDEDVFFGFCETLGLWRLKAPPFDAHGVIEPGGGIDGFYAALAEAVVELRQVRPDLAEQFARLLGSEGE